MPSEVLEKPKIKKPQFREVIRLPNGNFKVKLNFHRGQTRAWDSKARFVAMLMGTQGGKTVFGVEWLKREIERTYDPDDDTNDYLAVTATHTLMKMKMLPQLRYVFCELWKLADYHAADRVFQFHDSNIQVFVGSAQNPESIESATAKAAWLDEAGQNQFKREAYDAILRRLSIASDYAGRILFTTTIYNLGWLKQEIYDKWLKGDTTIEVIQEDSIVNPRFPRLEYERAKRTKPAWYFDMFYRGRYSRPAGLIYDSFDSAVQVIPAFEIPQNWPRYVGVDFAGPNGKTVALWYAMDPTGHFYLYREYEGTGKTVAQHCREWKALETKNGIREPIIQRYGGSKTEEGWREAFAENGCPILEPAIKDVEVGIQAVYAFDKVKKLSVFNHCLGYLDQKSSYRRELDINYEPTLDIADKELFHYMDAERYALSGFNADIDYLDMEVQVERYN